MSNPSKEALLEAEVGRLVKILHGIDLALYGATDLGYEPDRVTSICTRELLRREIAAERDALRQKLAATRGATR